MPIDYWFWKFLLVLVFAVVVGVFIGPKLSGAQAESFLTYFHRRMRELAKVYLLLAFLGLVVYLYFVFIKHP
jgi:hypothetical protein